MIITFTPNPSIDVTYELDGDLNRGNVHRVATTVAAAAGGKGVNVAHTIALAGRETLAVLPCAQADPFQAMLAETPVNSRLIEIDGHIRTNATIIDTRGGNTKLNGAGPMLLEAERLACERQLLEALSSSDVTWLVLAGSLPRGVPAHWYVSIIELVRSHFSHIRIAVDTSGVPLTAVGEKLGDPASTPDLIAPNANELATLLEMPESELKDRAIAGDRLAAISAGQALRERGLPELLVTLGSAGAVLLTEQGAWEVDAPSAIVNSSVGAGDSTVAGYLMARVDGADQETCLQAAVAYGSATTALPGTTLPRPGDLPSPLPAARRVR